MYVWNEVSNKHDNSMKCGHRRWFHDHQICSRVSVLCRNFTISMQSQAHACFARQWFFSFKVSTATQKQNSNPLLKEIHLSVWLNCDERFKIGFSSSSWSSMVWWTFIVNFFSFTSSVDKGDLILWYGRTGRGRRSAWAVYDLTSNNLLR